jgi:hypothetical protein
MGGNRAPRPVHHYAVDRWEVEQKLIHENALAEAERRADELKISEFGFITEAEKSLRNLKKL